MKESGSNYLIRRAQQGDIGSMTRLLKLLFSIEKDFLFDEPTQQRGLEIMLRDRIRRCVMVAEADGEVVGMCTGQLLVSTAEGGTSAVIEDLVVGDAHRGQGIGRDLLAVLSEWGRMQGVRRIQLLADRNNETALEFYRKMGWQRTEMICLRKKD